MFRLPDATHVGGVRLQVSDLSRALTYYQQILGLDVLTRMQDSAALGVRGATAPLVTLETRERVTAARRGALGLYHFAILLPDRPALGRFAAHLSAAGVRVGMADHLVSESLYLWDPDGLGIEVYADRPRSAWRYRGSELMMATDPLDVQSVIADGGGQRWDGMPAGTTMGHMHLSVGSLDEAANFYHAGLGMEKTVWSYPGALFLAAGGYHHHLGTNVWSPGPPAHADEARLLEWELVVPTQDDVRAAAESLRAAGYGTQHADDGATVEDPWGTRLRIVTR